MIWAPPGDDDENLIPAPLCQNQAFQHSFMHEKSVWKHYFSYKIMSENIFSRDNQKNRDSYTSLPKMASQKTYPGGPTLEELTASFQLHTSVRKNLGNALPQCAPMTFASRLRGLRRAIFGGGTVRKNTFFRKKRGILDRIRKVNNNSYIPEIFTFLR